MATNKLVSAAVRSVLFTSAVAAAGFPAYVMAQAAAPAVELEEVVVTGSLIPLDLNAPGVPVSVMSAADIQTSGVTTDLLDVLNKTQPFFFGGLNIGSENGNISSGSTNGGSQLALRNRSTLVLINGRRAAVSPVAASGGFNFVDVGMIPVAAVERIEVLADGASATYGADAVGGVVNLILKSDYDGVEVGGRYGMDQYGDYKQRSYYAVMGASTDKTDVTFSTEWRKNDPMLQADRGWACCQFRSPSFAGSVNLAGTTTYYYLNPALNAPPTDLDLTPAELVEQGIYLGPFTQGGVAQFFDLSEKPTMLIQSERKSAVLAVDHEINDKHSLFGDLLVSNSVTWSQLNAQPVSGRVEADNPNNPFDTAVTARNRFTAFPRQYETDTTGWRGVLGFRGDLFGTWKYEIAGNWNYTTSNFRNAGLIDAAAYAEAVEDGTYNPFARVQQPGVLESFQGNSFRDYTSSLYTYDARVYGDLFQLPAGAVQLAIGAFTGEEKLTYNNDRLDQTGGWLQATPTLPFAAKAQRQGYFAELRVPVFSEANAVPGFYALDLSLAGRQEVYDTTSDPFVPKFTLRWQPFGDTFAVRGSYSESFTAPSLYELFGPTGSGFTQNIVLERYDVNGDPTGETTDDVQYRSRSGSNSELDPSESENYTVGFVWTPSGAMEGFEASIDYYNIKETGIINTLPSDQVLQHVERYGPDSIFAQYVRLGQSVAGELRFDDGDPITAPGQITNRPSDEVWLSNSLINIAGIEQDGLDIKFSYSRDTASWGTFSGQLSTLYMLSYDQELIPTFPIDDLVGVYHDFYGLFPEWRAFLQLGWQMGGWSAGINGTFMPGVDDITFGVGASPDVDSYNSWDIQLGYDFSESGIAGLDGLRINAGINNVTDEEPPYIESEGNQSHDIQSYDPIGLFYYVDLSYKF
ncbi:MAG: TonB-dependent receptor [Steroidobacteraceae bacterium]|nr:TonB-dependent receptor [Steroidobacteraceae bacterium]